MNKQLYIDILRCLRDAVRRKRPEKWRKHGWFLLDDNALAHRSVSVKDILPNDNVTALEYNPILSWPVCCWFLSTSSTEISIEGNDAFVMLLISLRMQRKSWKGFHKTASRNIYNTFTIAGKVYSCTRGYFDGNAAYTMQCFVFHRNKVIPRTFWSCHVQLPGITSFRKERKCRSIRDKSSVK